MLADAVDCQHGRSQYPRGNDSIVTQTDQVGHEIVENSLLMYQVTILGCKLEAGVWNLLVGNESG